MPTYSLRYDAQGDDVEKRIDFNAVSSAGALEFADCEAEGRSAQLYQEDRAICTLYKAGESNLWLVGPPNSK